MNQDKFKQRVLQKLYLLRYQLEHGKIKRLAYYANDTTITYIDDKMVYHWIKNIQIKNSCQFMPEIISIANNAWEVIRRADMYIVESDGTATFYNKESIEKL